MIILPAHHINKDRTIWWRGCPLNERTTYRIDPLVAHLPAPIIAPLPGHQHPSQGILATSATGAACSVYYIYGAAQAVALASRAAGTPFNPRSLDLPSIGALVGFNHACLGFPVKQTWLDAIKAGNCDTFDGLTHSNAAKYCPDSDETIMGHLAQQRQNVRHSIATCVSTTSHCHTFQPGLCHDTATEHLPMTQAAFLSGLVPVTNM